MEQHKKLNNSFEQQSLQYSPMQVIVQRFVCLELSTKYNE